MMAYKHLHELLKEDQEPFQLKNYIFDKRWQLQRVNNPQTTVQVKKRNAQNSPVATKHSFCKHACFLSFQDSPDGRKSPFFDFPAPVQRSNAVFLHVPAKTAALLFEAAMRVQAKKSSKRKAEIRSSGFGFLGSMLKKLKDRNKNKNKKKGIGDSFVEEEKCVEEEMIVSCYCNDSRVSSTVWSESNEEKSLDLETSCSSRSEDSVEEAFAAYEKRFCSTSLSPFRHSLHRSSSGQRTPDLSSPAASPTQKNDKKQEQKEGSNIVLEDETEQCSPVSVLETLFEVDDDDHHGQNCGDGDEYEDEDEYYYDSDDECNGSYAIVQKAKEQLLDKLRRFEKLAELDPIELEKRMMEEEEYEDDEASSLGSEIHNLDTPMVTEVLRQARFQQSSKFQMHMERLVSDLITEERKEMNVIKGDEVMVRSICQKLNSWKEVQPHSIDMLVHFDFGREYDCWKKHDEQSREIAGEIEVLIFRVLVDELAEELCY